MINTVGDRERSWPLFLLQITQIYYRRDCSGVLAADNREQVHNPSLSAHLWQTTRSRALISLVRTKRLLTCWTTFFKERRKVQIIRSSYYNFDLNGEGRIQLSSALPHSTAFCLPNITKQTGWSFDQLCAINTAPLRSIKSCFPMVE